MARLEDARRRSAPEPRNIRLREKLILASMLGDWWLAIAILSALLMGWEWQVQAGNISALFFPAPSTIAATFVDMAGSGELPLHLGVTLKRMLIGLLLGGLPGLLLGLFMGWWPRLRQVVDPFIAAIHPLPKLALLPLVMLILGIGEISKVFLIGIGCFFPLLINAMVGVRQISPVHFEVAENYGASRSRVFRHVVIPGSLPYVLSGVRLALNTALLLTIAVELLAAQEGLGSMVWFAWQTLRTEELYATLVVIAALGIGFNLILQWLAGRIVPWQMERQT